MRTTMVAKVEGSIERQFCTCEDCDCNTVSDCALAIDAAHQIGLPRECYSCDDVVVMKVKYSVEISCVGPASCEHNEWHEQRALGEWLDYLGREVLQ